MPDRLLWRWNAVEPRTGITAHGGFLSYDDAAADALRELGPHARYSVVSYLVPDEFVRLPSFRNDD